ncbi:MAG TPA: HAD family hydrolase [Nocardioides sp.]|uniref:HAD family hydrolase n=1 Tax=uncultured Nocardioides sp. TaxID=198441 RepID=UPI000EE3D647|nr:HAD family hydrolase [uncultured Nocardioides sp.]HCB06863.1 haloacid dehalogenase-like hydrolase [Nocardioides sp.]HRD59990.1 HAD family hydrolase [Nocardioides sp.]HRI94570.1 HAD family hydrolase [Nocardioides sp.]HRK44453.1 HAD family hydrolase [Nocardioides sp.]
MTDDLLPSWRAGATRDEVEAFLEAAADVPVEQRVACFDNDGTLWCERPSYVQLDFFLDAMKTALQADPKLAEKPEFAALVSGDQAAIGELGLDRIAVALSGLFEGQTPEEFTALARDFMARGRHQGLDRPIREVTYQPMLELLAALRQLDFTLCVVTGGGTEFVRAVSQDLYGVPSQNVVGSMVAYEFVPTADDGTGPSLRRTTQLVGEANEGAVKVNHIQTQLGRRPILAAGNSGGDREMLEWATAADGPSLALLVDHDDADREFAYVSSAVTFAEPEPITDVGHRLGWTVVSMANDWSRIF